MKTFKLVGLKIELQDENDTVEELPLVDGLIINKEDSKNHWLIEALLEKKYSSTFEQFQEQDQEVHLQVTITNKNNFPAKIYSKVKSITFLKNHISVLLEGRLHATRQKVQAEQLLGDLLDQGFSGDLLLHEFKTQLQVKK